MLKFNFQKTNSVRKFVIWRTHKLTFCQDGVISLLTILKLTQFTCKCLRGFAPQTGTCNLFQFYFISNEIKPSCKNVNLWVLQITNFLTEFVFWKFNFIIFLENDKLLPSFTKSCWNQITTKSVSIVKIQILKFYIQHQNYHLRVSEISSCSGNYET